MWNTKEEDLDEFRMTCKDRLSPEGAAGFMFGGILYSSIAVFSIIVSGGWEYCMVLLNIGIVKIEVLLYALQVIFSLYIYFQKLNLNFKSYKHLLYYYTHFKWLLYYLQF
ncbi:hypothetical protein IK1_01321 [Bacillus cereus VD146]|uniref:Uncharacterized protein n=1 Tax=Bacillus cereus (strain VD146) TaxID=1053236 RepID=R8N4S5_BACCX|nr:hypothetical protein IK1_01321 [Bacillus cereus VD146]